MDQYCSIKRLLLLHQKVLKPNHVYIQGNANVSRKYSVGIATPTNSGTAGDVVWKSTPEEGSNWGWVYTTDNEWYPFANISIDKDQDIYIFDGVGVGTTTPGTQIHCKLVLELH